MALHSSSDFSTGYCADEDPPIFVVLNVLNNAYCLDITGIVKTESEICLNLFDRKGVLSRFLYRLRIHTTYIIRFE